MVGRKCHLLEGTVIIVDRHTDITLKRISSVNERTHLHGDRLQRIEGLASHALQQERTTLVEHQLRRSFQQSAVNIGVFTIVGMRQNSSDGAVKRQRFALKLITRLR